MNQILKFARNEPSTRNAFPHVVSYAQARSDVGLPAAQLYRSEAVAEDLVELYPHLSLDLKPRRQFARTALVTVWMASLVLATMVVIHTTLA